MAEKLKDLKDAICFPDLNSPKEDKELAVDILHRFSEQMDKEHGEA